MSWMIYGANGYTGALLAEHAVAAGERPVLAGRSADAVRTLAERLGLPWRAFDLAAPFDGELADVEVVAHCAGPFSHTSAPMVAACLRTGTHYLDLTGEVDVFEAIYARHDDALRAGVALVPGVGFDVVPTDYLAVTLAAELPTATQLDIALISRGGFSAGTLKTGVEGMRQGGRVRAGGELVPVPLAHRALRVALERGHATVHSVPLGDISSAFRATQIPNITNFTVVPLGGLANRFDPLIRTAMNLPGAGAAVGRLIGAVVSGPSEQTRASTRSELWAQARDESGNTAQARVCVANTYEFTVASTLAAVRATLAGVLPGAWTPSQAFGHEFFEAVNGARAQLI